MLNSDTHGKREQPEDLEGLNDAYKSPTKSQKTCQNQPERIQCKECKNAKS